MDSEILNFEKYLDNIDRNKNGYSIKFDELSSWWRIREKISNIDFLKDFFSKRKNIVENKFINDTNVFNNYIKIKETDTNDSLPCKIINNLYQQMNTIHLDMNNLRKIRFSLTTFKIKSDDYTYYYRIIKYYLKIIFNIDNYLFISKNNKIINSEILSINKDKEKKITEQIFSDNTKEFLEDNIYINEVFNTEISLSWLLKINKDNYFVFCAKNDNEKDLLIKINKLKAENKIFGNILNGFLNILSNIIFKCIKNVVNIKLKIFEEMIFYEMYYFESFINLKLIILESNNNEDFQLITSGNETYKSLNKNKELVVKDNQIKLFFKDFNIFLIINSIDNFSMIYNKYYFILNKFKNEAYNNYLKSRYLFFNLDRLNEKLFLEFDENKNLINISNLFLKGFTFFINIPYSLENIDLTKIINIKFEEILKEQKIKEEILKYYEICKYKPINDNINLMGIIINFTFSKNGCFTLFFEEKEKDKVIKNKTNELNLLIPTQKGLDEAILIIENKIKAIFNVSREDIIESLKNIDLKKIKIKEEDIENTILSYYFNLGQKKKKFKKNKSIVNNNKRASTVLNIIGLKNTPIISNFDDNSYKIKKESEILSKKSSMNESDTSSLFNYGNDIIETINEPFWDNLDILDEDLYIYSWSIFDSIGIVDDYSIQKKIYFNFIKEVHDKYSLNNNFYHNFKHAIMVLHGCFYFIKNTIAGKYFNEIGVTAIIFSGLVHDIAHSGRNNFYEMNSLSDIALNHNDYSVLESHHISTAFKIINKKKFNIFEEMDMDTFRSFRKNCINMILHTDMKFHFKNASSFKEKVESKLFFPYQEGVNKKIINELDFDLFSGILIHTADLYIPTKEIDDSLRWSDLVNLEFKNQHKLEKENNLPFFPFYKDLDKPKVVCNNEIQFIDKMVRPLWFSLNLFLEDGLKNHLNNIDKVIENWREKLKNHE